MYKRQDGYLAQVSLPLARALLGVSEGATQLAVFLENEKHQARVKGEIEPLISGPEAGVFDWEDIMPDLVLFVRMDNAGAYIFMGIIMVVVALGILNTILMSVLERTREFGLMIALGMDPRAVDAGSQVHKSKRPILARQRHPFLAVTLAQQHHHCTGSPSHMAGNDALGAA